MDQDGTFSKFAALDNLSVIDKGILSSDGGHLSPSFSFVSREREKNTLRLKGRFIVIPLKKEIFADFPADRFQSDPFGQSERKRGWRRRRKEIFARHPGSNKNRA